MKQIIILSLLTANSFFLSAQNTDSSTMKMDKDSTPMNNNSMRMDSANMNNRSDSNMHNTIRPDSSSANSSVNNNISGSDTASHNINSSSTSNMSSNVRTDSTSNMNSNSGMNSMNNHLNSMNATGRYAALPVLENYIPDAVVSKVKEKYGNSIYDITSLKTTTDQPQAYLIRVGENGIYKTEKISEDGSAVQ